MRKLALLLFIVYAHTLLAQSLVGNVVRLNPTTVPATCNTGDLRVDANAAFVLKICVANVWSAITGGGSGNATQLQGFNIATATPTSGQVLTWNSTASAWTPQPATGGGGGTWGSITGTLSAQTDLQSALNLLAPLASPTFTGTVTAPTFVGALTGNVTGNVTGSSGSTTGNAATVTTNANLTGPITSSGNATSVAAQTGTGTKFVMDTSPSLITPALGTPTALVGTNITGTGASFTAGNVTTNANLTGPVTSVGNATTITAGSVTNAMLAGSIDLTAKVTGALPILNGGTANTTKTAAFDALSPLSNTGDMLAFISSHNARVATTATTITWPYTSGGGTVPNLFSMLAPSAISGGPGSKNYLSSYNSNAGNGTFEDSTVNHWTLGLVGTLTNGLPTGTPTFGSGTSGNLSIGVINSGQIAGVYSLGYVSAASTTAGNMVASDAVSIDLEDQAKVLTVKFYYNVHTGVNVSNFSGTSSNSFAWAVWDATNSVWLSSAGNFCMTQNSGVGYCTGTVQTGATTASVQLVLYNANATSGATTLYLDDFSLGPQTAPMGPVVTDWVPYTPTFTGVGTPTGVSISSRRVGDTLQVAGKFSSGTATGVPPLISVGYNGVSGNVTIDTTKIAASSVVGAAILSPSSTTIFGWSILAPASNLTTVVLTIQTSTISATTASTVATTSVGTGTLIEFYFTVPIVGWSSNTSQSSDTDTRVVAFYAAPQAPTGTLTTSFNVTKFGTITQDTHGAYSASTGLYTAPVTGWYSVSATLDLNCTTSTAGNYHAAAVEVNGSVVASAYFPIQISTTVKELSVPVTWIGYVTAGQTIGVYGFSQTGTPIYGTGLGSSFMSINRLSGPAVVQATESVNARYFSSSSTIGTSVTPLAVTFATKDFDSHNAYSGGTYTIPVSGKYALTTCLYQTAATTAANQGVAIEIFKNGTLISFIENWYTSASSKPLSTCISDTLNDNAGDAITIKAGNDGTTPSISARAIRG